MHGNLGLYHDGTSAYVPARHPPPEIPVQELLSRGGGLNVLLSDHLPLDRAAVDSRISSCKRQQYDISNLPKASVVIIFHNEPFSTLLRSVHSVLNLTPPPLLEEIILVDDGSDLDYITGSRRFMTATAAAGPGGSVEGERQFAAVKFSDGEAEVIEYGSAEDEEEDRRRLARLRSRSQHTQQPALPGSPNYRVTPTLKEYLELLPEKVKLLRNKERKGIVGARMRGIRAAKAPVFVILDSHIEVQPQWMEPLLLRIAADRHRIVMPQIDGIEADTFEYAAGGIGCKLGFLWKLMEHSYESHQVARFAASSVKALRSRAPPPVVATAVEGAEQGGGATGDEIGGKILTPVGSAETSPVMAGGLFAADKTFFFEIGAYDEAFQYWGTENLELSFRLWQCGGLLECAPCSRVYHIFRKGGAGYSVPPQAVTVNKMRTLLWMDQYADLAWRVLGKPRVDFGWESLQQRKKWREEKKCKNFEWFLHNVFPEGDVVDLRDVPYLGRTKAH
ncbi:UNVERIFIED_CONTAM: hypothetical protein H355_004783 [Colinus virginianus]|nr:hypothetical protein H355_004783 [Colinus virginianus]